MDTITDILKDSNENIRDILRHKDNKFLREFMETAFYPDKKLNLPEGEPPFKPLPLSEHQMKGSFWQFCRKIGTLRRTDVKALRLETIFIQEIESMAESEAKIVIAMKDQTLSTMFPNLTLDKLKAVGYF